MQSKVTWREAMHFEGELDGITLPLDSDPRFGGSGKGPKPKDLLLTSLAGCTAMDVIAMLGKMRIEPESFSVEAEGDLATEHPKVFTRIVLTFRVKGRDIPEDKVRKAVDLSQSKYCGVTAMLRDSVPIETRIVIEA